MFIVGINSFFDKIGACFELGIRPPNFHSERKRHMNTLLAKFCAFKFRIYNLRTSNSTPAELFIIVFTYSNCQSIQSSKSSPNHCNNTKYKTNRMTRKTSGTEERNKLYRKELT